MTLAAIYKTCSVKTIFRLIEFYCFFPETVGNAYSLALTLLKDTERRVGLTEIEAGDLTYYSGFACGLAYILENFDKDTDLDGYERWFESFGFIQGAAERGYTYGQYWMGYLAEVGKDYPDDKEERVCKTRAIDWYRKAADQGCVLAQKRLAIVSEQCEREIADINKLLGKCSYCGGNFKGLFKKVCSSCGKPKDY